MSAAQIDGSYAALLRLAVVDPRLLTAQDHARLTPEDRAIVLGVIDAHLDRTGVDLTRRQREKRTGHKEPRQHAIGKARWQTILDGMRGNTMRVSDLSMLEINTIDNDPGLAAEFDQACSEGWR